MFLSFPVPKSKTAPKADKIVQEKSSDMGSLPTDTGENRAPG